MRKFGKIKHRSMNPQQPSHPSGSGSEYDFFMNPEQAPKQNPLSRFGGGNSMITRLIVVLAGLILLIILFAIVSSILGGDSNKPNLIIVAQDQNEIVRVADEVSQIGDSQSAQSTQNFATSAALSVQTEQQDLLNFLAAHGTKLSQGQLTATKDTSTDAQLNNAVAASNFDATFKTIMNSQLKNYRNALTIAYQHAKNSDEKQLLSNDYDGAALLLTQLSSPEH